jgi:hypothetical protein
MRVVIAALLAVQFGQRPPLTPAQTLLEPELLRAIERASVEGPMVQVIAGSNNTAGEIVLACEAECEPVEWAMKRLVTSGVPQPSRTIRVITVQQPLPDTKAAIFVAESTGSGDAGDPRPVVHSGHCG